MLNPIEVYAHSKKKNHNHLLLDSHEGGLTEVHRLAARCAQHFNRQHKKNGYVFQGRFRSILAEEGPYIKTLMRYIHFNPLEAGLVSRPQDYPWSSHNGYFSQANWIKEYNELRIHSGKF